MRIELMQVNNKIIKLLKGLTPPFFWNFLYKKLVVKNIEKAYAYNPHYQQWLEPAFISRYKAIKKNTGCPIDSTYILTYFLRQTMPLKGDVMEAGVWKGGTAKLLKDEIASYTDPAYQKKLYLFDSFEGMLETSADNDRHIAGNFSDTSLESVREFVGSEKYINYRKGWIPSTFSGLEENIFSFAHIDLDLYQSILDCLIYVYPRMASGGVIIFDDYGYASCPGALRAVNEFFSDKPEKPLSMHTGQGLVIIR